MNWSGTLGSFGENSALPALKRSFQTLSCFVQCLNGSTTLAN